MATGTESPAMRDRLYFLLKIRRALQNSTNKWFTKIETVVLPSSIHKTDAFAKQRLVAGNFLVQPFGQIFDVVVFGYLLPPTDRDVIKAVKQPRKSACNGAGCIGVLA